MDGKKKPDRDPLQERKVKLSEWMQTALRAAAEDTDRYAKDLLDLGFDDVQSISEDATEEDFDKIKMKPSHRRRIWKWVNQIRATGKEPLGSPSGLEVIGTPGHVPTLQCRKARLECVDDQGNRTVYYLEPMGSAGDSSSFWGSHPSTKSPHAGKVNDGDESDLDGFEDEGDQSQELDMNASLRENAFLRSNSSSPKGRRSRRASVEKKSNAKVNKADFFTEELDQLDLSGTVDLGPIQGFCLPEDPSAWTVEDVVNWLRQYESLRTKSYVDEFQKQRVNGPILLAMSEYDVEGLGIQFAPHKRLLLKEVDNLRRLKDRLGSNSRETESGSEGFRSPEHDWDAKEFKKPSKRFSVEPIVIDHDIEENIEHEESSDGLLIEMKPEEGASRTPQTLSAGTSVRKIKESYRAGENSAWGSMMTPGTQKKVAAKVNKAVFEAQQDGSKPSQRVGTDHGNRCSSSTLERAEKSVAVKKRPQSSSGLRSSDQTFEHAKPMLESRTTERKKEGTKVHHPASRMAKALSIESKLDAMQMETYDDTKTDTQRSELDMHEGAIFPAPLQISPRVQTPVPLRDSESVVGNAEAEQLFPLVLNSSDSETSRGGRSEDYFQEDAPLGLNLNLQLGGDMVLNVPDDGERTSIMDLGASYEISQGGTLHIGNYLIRRDGMEEKGNAASTTRSMLKSIKEGELHLEDRNCNSPSMGFAPKKAGKGHHRRIGDSIILLDELGRGACGVVYKGLYAPTLTLVAVKSIIVYDQSKRKQMLGELMALHSMSKAYFEDHEVDLSLTDTSNDLSVTASPMRGGSPYIVAFYDAYTDPDKGTVMLVLEYMNGGTLQDLVKPEGLDEATLAFIAESVLKGLHEIHSRHQIHRDIKPCNILIDQDGNVKISDFGVARALDSTFSVANTFTGTVTYMSPERIANQEYSYASDVWSFGLVIATLALGKVPLPTKGGYFAVLQAIQDKDPPALPQDRFSSDLCDFVAQCLKKDPGQRPQALELLNHEFISKAKQRSRVPPNSRPEFVEDQNKKIKELFRKVLEYQMKIAHGNDWEDVLSSSNSLSESFRFQKIRKRYFRNLARSFGIQVDELITVFQKEALRFQKHIQQRAKESPTL